MNQFTYRVGVPAEDALFLLSGFSDAHEEDDAAWRNCAKVFRLLVPTAVTGETRLTLRMRFIDTNFRLTLRAGDHVLGAIAPEQTDWHDLTVTLAKSGGDVVALTGELDRDPYGPPKPKIEPNRRYVDLAQITAEGSDLSAPERCTRARIGQAPIRLTNLRTSANAVRRAPPASAERTVFFGDVHVHTNYSYCGHPNNGTVEENVAAAKQRGHDFIAVTDHGEHMDPDTWAGYFDELAACSERHDLPILPATEWTSREHGHRNIYFRQTRPPYVDYFNHETDHPAKLGAFFERHGLDALAVPHHFPYVGQPGNVETITPEVEPLIEVYSSWGSSEHYGARLQDVNRILPGCTVKDALARGLKLGFVGGGDVHNALPGDGGMTAVLAEEPTVDGLFDGLRHRLCYATSGPRIFLDFHINGFPMGSVIKVNAYSIDKLFPLSIVASAVGAGPVERMELIGNGEVIYVTTHRTSAAENEMTLRLSMAKLATPNGVANTLNQHLVNYSRYYYVRVVQSDGAMAWSSPIWVDFSAAG